MNRSSAMWWGPAQTVRRYRSHEVLPPACTLSSHRDSAWWCYCPPEYNTVRGHSETKEEANLYLSMLFLGEPRNQITSQWDVLKSTWKLHGLAFCFNVGVHYVTRHRLFILTYLYFVAVFFVAWVLLPHKKNAYNTMPESGVTTGSGAALGTCGRGACSTRGSCPHRKRGWL